MKIDLGDEQTIRELIAVVDNTPAMILTPCEQGWIAGNRGEPERSNPFPPESVDFDDWDRGYGEGIDASEENEV